jgi:hypothetical protein
MGATTGQFGWREVGDDLLTLPARAAVGNPHSFLSLRFYREQQRDSLLRWMWAHMRDVTPSIRGSFSIKLVRPTALTAPVAATACGSLLLHGRSAGQTSDHPRFERR